MKIVTIIGARPQFIKAATVSRALQSYNSVNEVIIHTGQHYDANMSQVFFDELDIPHPQYNLGIGGGTHGQNTGRMIEQIEAALLHEQPDWVMVYGDTDSTLAGALAGVKLHIPVAHVEAGLRSFNRNMPEEINRVLTDHAADLLFTPTETGTRNLADEGIAGDKVQQVGDVMYDAVLYYGEIAEQRSRILDVLGIEPKDYFLATIHRAENTDDQTRMKNILAGFANLPQGIILPLHPRTRKQLINFDLALPSNVRAIDPVGYLDMVMLEKNAALIATDSGGVQKEAYFHKVPCVTLRDETEWVELIEVGANCLVSDDVERIASVAQSILKVDESCFMRMFYGNGESSINIADRICDLGALRGDSR